MTTSARRVARKAISWSEALAFRQRLQRLEQRSDESLEELVRNMGFPCVTTGASPYLSLRARSPRVERRSVDQALFETQALVEVPFARGSNVLASPIDAPALLAAARHDHARKVHALEKESRVDPKKRQRLAESIVNALEGGPLAADELRSRLPESLSVAFGEPGRKAGLPSLFALSMRDLICDGLVARQQKECRLDVDGFRYALVPHAPEQLDRDAALKLLAERYFRVAAPATVSGFAFWADATLTEARAALHGCPLAEAQVDGSTEPCFVPQDLVEELAAFEAPFPPRFAFVPFRDPLVSLSRDLRPLLHADHKEVLLADWRGRLVPAGGGSIVHQHFVVHGGAVIGIWEFSAATGRVTYATMSPLATRQKRLADQMADELGEWLSRELGDARFYADDRAEGYGRIEQVVSGWNG